MTTIVVVCATCGELQDHCPPCKGTGCTLPACQSEEYCDFSGRPLPEAEAHAPRCFYCKDTQWWCKKCDPPLPGTV